MLAAAHRPEPQLPLAVAPEPGLADAVDRRCLAAEETGPVLLFAAEDAGHIVRTRLEGTARAASAAFENRRVPAPGWWTPLRGRRLPRLAALHPDRAKRC